MLRWSKVTTVISNLILGRLAVDHAGTMRVVSSTGAHTAKIRFKEQSVLSKVRTLP